MQIETKFSLPFSNAPQWLASLEVTRVGDEIRIEALRSSGTLLGEVRVGVADFAHMTDIILADVS